MLNKKNFGFIVFTIPSFLASYVTILQIIVPDLFSNENISDIFRYGASVYWFKDAVTLFLIYMLLAMFGFLLWFYEDSRKILRRMFFVFTVSGFFYCTYLGSELKTKASLNSSRVKEEAILANMHWNGIDIEVVGCYKVSGRIDCKLKLTSTGKDSVFNLFKSSAIFDNNGVKNKIFSITYNGYDAIEIGKKDWIWHELIMDVPVEVKLSFLNSNQDAEYISALKLTLTKTKKGGFGDPHNKKVVSLRSIPLE
ncbi:hypothetical protein [Marinomonas mediterranea]|jgi:hypothetical protein|uniref:Uncharacterized protein n=1 Tax=Marinomonas mediterranea (strain ATCC 700492 / JCM 21426 / NBRC 103028 / MMB-1) TaxID=717774 RepID=F2K236_MARM1|nr:hypothetical protein [Marinomonas mediterranea]ADZ91114.1 hypothetical protein Marme_1858 [Marinomonas mediterranea MMB-1]WCN17246.1 hypothetical protein GV053_09380 [Marinomonas mediterranea MMB-1]